MWNTEKSLSKNVEKATMKRVERAFAKNVHCVPHSETRFSCFGIFVFNSAYLTIYLFLVVLPSKDIRLQCINPVMTS